MEEVEEVEEVRVVEVVVEVDPYSPPVLIHTSKQLK